MDKSKLVWPQYSFRKPKSLDRLLRPRIVCTLAMGHGWTCQYSSQTMMSSRMVQAPFCEVLSTTLGRVAELAAVAGIKMPDHLVIQSDNTTAQATNPLVGQLLATLVAASTFQTRALNLLIVGHTRTRMLTWPLVYC